MHRLWLCLAAAMMSAGWCLAEEAAIRLESGSLQLEVQPAPAPYLARLVHQPSGVRLLAEPAAKDLFQIDLKELDGKITTVSSAQAKQSSVQKDFGPEKSRFVLTYQALAGLDLAVQVVVEARPKDPLLYWTLRVENRTGKPMDRILFPYLVAPHALGQPEDDVLVLPALPGALIRNPASAWPVGYKLLLSYPGNLSSQFVSYQDRSAGLYLASMDVQGHPMGFSIGKRREGMILYHQWTPVPADQAVWESPYPVVLAGVQGSWQQTADLYKQWAVRQPWCTKRLAQREDIPDWWKQGPLVYVSSARFYGEYNNKKLDGSFYPMMCEHLRAVREKVEGPLVVMLSAWEKHRCWTGGDYFPIFDEAHALPVIAQMRQEGFRPFFFLSGLFYTFKNEGVDPGEIPGAERYMDCFVLDKQGKPEVFVLDESRPNRPWRRLSYQFCPAAQASKEFFLQVVDQAIQRGVDVLQMDQTVSGAGAVCYSKKHGHPPGPGLYQTQAFHDLLRQIRQHGKQKSKDFVLFHEEPHEQLIPLLDGFHVREYYEKRWYRSFPGAVGIPLFSYLYHEYAIGYGGDSAGLSPANSRELVRTHALNLVTGRTPGVGIWGAPQRFLDAHPDQIRLIRAHCRLLKTRARDFLMLGRMLHSLELDVPKLTFHHYPLYKPNADNPVEDYAILTSSWQSPDGRVGHLFVNISESPQPLRVHLDARNAPGWPAADAALYSSETAGRAAASEKPAASGPPGEPPTDGFLPLWKGVRLPQEFSRQLAPGEVIFIELRPSAGERKSS